MKLPLRVQIGGFIAVLCLAFVTDIGVVSAVRTAPDWLREGAKSITWLGKSDWIAVVLIIVALTAALRDRAAKSRSAQVVIVMAAAVFLSVLLSGIAVQFLKHIIGRARPVHFETLGAFAFVPFKFDYSFNSFPSGHSTTLGSVGFILVWLFPRAKGWIIAATVLVAATRVTVGSHYPSDVVAGLTLGAVFSWFLLSRMERRGVLPGRSDPVWDRLGAYLRGSGEPSLRSDLGLLRQAWGRIFRALGQGLAALWSKGE